MLSSITGVFGAESVSASSLSPVPAGRIELQAPLNSLSWVTTALTGVNVYSLRRIEIR